MGRFQTCRQDVEVGCDCVTFLSKLAGIVTRQFARSFHLFPSSVVVHSFHMKSARLLLMLVLLSDAGSSAAPVELLTPQEAAQLELPTIKDPKTGKLSAPGDKTSVPGAPAIFFDMPVPGTPVATPFPVKVRFVPAGDAKVLIDTLKIEVLKLIPISLIAKVKPYLSAEGINVPEAKIPSGKYNVRVAISDDKGREGVALQTWVVK